jgi:hypothetical protein
MGCAIMEQARIIFFDEFPLDREFIVDMGIFDVIQKGH